MEKMGDNMMYLDKLQEVSTAQEFRDFAREFMYEEECDEAEALKCYPLVLEKGKEFSEIDSMAYVVDLIIGVQSGWPAEIHSDENLRILDGILQVGLDQEEFPNIFTPRNFCMLCARLFFPVSQGRSDVEASDLAREMGYAWIDRAVEFCMKEEKGDAKYSLKETIQSVAGEYVGLQIEDKAKGEAIIEYAERVFGKPFASALRKSCQDFL
jgi:hypothetical protein